MSTPEERLEELIREARGAAAAAPLTEPELSAGPVQQFSEEAERIMGHWPAGYLNPQEAELVAEYGLRALGWTR